MEFQKGNKFGKGRPKEPVNMDEAKTVMRKEIANLGILAYSDSQIDIQKRLNEHPDHFSAAGFLLMTQICKGNLKALQMLEERILGKPLQEQITENTNTNFHAELVLDEEKGE